jgi:hypothetical protein
MIKDRKYNVEYEGLHLLCINCGKFGHFKEGCPDKTIVTEEIPSVRIEAESLTGINNSTADGPWLVVQKQRRSRKGKEKEASATEGGGRRGSEKITQAAPITGSRFESLMNEIPDLVPENIQLNENGNIPINVISEIGEINKKSGNNEMHHKGMKTSEKGMAFFGKGSGTNKTQSMMKVASQDKSVKKSSLAARGIGSFKTSGKGEVLKKKQIETLFAEKFNQVTIVGNEKEHTGCSQGEKNMLPSASELKRNNILGFEVGLKGISCPNMPRPPDEVNGPSNSSVSLKQNEEHAIIDGEELLDADDNGTIGSLDSDMELVSETPANAQ